MKSRSRMGWIATLFAILVSTHNSYGQTDSLVLSSGTTAANGTVSLNLTLTSPAGNEPSAVQWTFTFPSSNVVSISATAGTSATSAGKTLSCVAGTGTYTCLAYGINTNIITNGTLAAVNLTIASGVTTTNIGLGSTYAASAAGASITLSPTGGVVTGGGPAPLVPTSLSCLPTSLPSLGTATCTVTISGAAPAGGIAVALSSNNLLLTVPVPPLVTVLATATTATFTVIAVTIPSDQTAIVTATLNGTPKTASLSLAAPVLVSSLSCTPASIVSNATSVCTASLTKAAPGGTVITITNVNPLLTTPSTVTATVGQTSVSFNATAGTVPSSQLVSISASINGSSAPASLTLQPAPDTTPPTVSITAPAANATVSNTVAVSATAADNVGVADVQFQLDGVNLGADLTAPPYSISWNTTGASNGTHHLTAIAHDTSHNAATSAIVTVTVTNTVTGPPTAGLIGYWNFDENAGNIAHDTSGSGYNGTVYGAAWTAGKINSALSFNGSTNVVYVPSVALSNAFSISTWVNSAGAQGAYSGIAETVYSIGLYLGTNASGTGYKFIVNGGSGTSGSCGLALGCTEGGAVSSGWHLVTGTYDGTTANLYVDNALVASDRANAPANSSLPLYIGRYYAGNSNAWNGGIDEVRIYNRALTAAEVTAIYNYTGGAPNNTPPTVSITTPAANTTVSSTITVTAAATSSVGVADVQFQLDGVNLGADLTAAPYSMSWNTTTVSNGVHNLTAIVHDTSHNAATSAIVTVTVSNTVTGLPTAGLIGYWNFDENAGNIAHDTSGSGYNGTVYGAGWTAGKINSALSFNGSTNVVYVPSVALSNAFSVSTWVNSAGAQGAYSGIAETVYSIGLYLGTNATGTRYKFIVNGGSGTSGSCGLALGCTEGGAVSSGWHLVTGTYDGTTANLYVDNALVASDRANAPANSSLPLYIGRYYAGNSNAWNGGIDEVRLYSRALTAAEITAIYNYTGGAPNNTPPTVSITTPTANTTVSSTITVTAAATSSVGVADVQFQLDGVNVADLTAAPYSMSWNTTTVSNGVHNLTAIVHDISHNTATSATVPVMVNNTVAGPPTAGLIGYWNFDENAGSIAHDTSGSGYNGTVYGAGWTAGKINSALSFNGSTNVVYVPSVALSNVFSISTWVNSPGAQGGYSPIAETVFSTGLYLGTNASGTGYKFVVNGGTGSKGTCGAIAGCAEGGVVSSGWHLVTGTYDGTTASLYVDNVLVASDITSAPANTSLPLYIGRYYAGNAYGWNGAIDEVRIYNRALTAAEVTAIYNYTGGGVDTTPPTVSITTPAANTTVSNTVTVTATASDNVAVADVQVQLDGVNLGADLTTPPYSISWNTTAASNGIHNLTAIAHDASHNAATSAIVSVTVSNTVGVPGGPPTTGLIGYWNFDENAGNIAHDTSGSGYNGTVYGAAWTAGKIKSALSFNGSTNVVYVPSVALSNAFSISTWVNSPGAQGGYSPIAETVFSTGLYLGTNASGAGYKFTVNGGTGSKGTCGATGGCAEGGVVSSGWHLVTGTYDGTTASLYVDNVLVASDTANAPASTSLPLYIGRYYAGNAYGWNGVIDEVRIYNRALTATEVSAIFGN